MIVHTMVHETIGDVWKDCYNNWILSLKPTNLKILYEEIKFQTDQSGRTTRNIHGILHSLQ